jgi:DNA-binding CsgD family transcriptional regulator
MAEERPTSDYVARSVVAGAEAVVAAQRDPQRLKVVFERNRIPMVMVDAQRRYIEVNRPARLWFRLSLEEIRGFAIGELTPAAPAGVMQTAWSRLLDVGSVAGPYPVGRSDASDVEVVYLGIAEIVPGLHLIAFAPADWSEDELHTIEDAGSATSLTPRELEVLALAADGLNVKDLAHALELSPGTIKTHLENIHRKLHVQSRAAAVAKAMRLGVID